MKKETRIDEKLKIIKNKKGRADNLANHNMKG